MRILHFVEPDYSKRLKGFRATGSNSCGWSRWTGRRQALVAKRSRQTPRSALVVVAEGNWPNCTGASWPHRRKNGQRSTRSSDWQMQTSPVHNCAPNSDPGQLTQPPLLLTNWNAATSSQAATFYGTIFSRDRFPEECSLDSVRSAKQHFCKKLASFRPSSADRAVHVLFGWGQADCAVRPSDRHSTYLSLSVSPTKTSFHFQWTYDEHQKRSAMPKIRCQIGS